MLDTELFGLPWNRVGVGERIPEDQVSDLSRLNSPACTYPYQRFATPSRDVDAWLGAVVGR